MSETITDNVLMWAGLLRNTWTRLTPEQRRAVRRIDEDLYDRLGAMSTAVVVRDGA